MSIITNLTRMWLTRSVQPFTFKNEYDQVLPYSGCENLGLYIHIPFCKSICNFCPYCKVRYDKELCERYLDTLLKEIRMVAASIPNESASTACILAAAPLRWWPTD